MTGRRFYFFHIKEYAIFLKTLGKTYLEISRITNFSISTIFHWCNPSSKIESIQHKKQYNLKNRDKQLKQKQEYYKKNIEKLRKDRRNYYKQNKSKLRLKYKNYYDKNKKFIINKQCIYRKTNIQAKIRNNLRRRFSLSIKNNWKFGSAIKDLGCSIDFFKTYIESKWIQGMSWNNYGQWHFDHIKPLSSFDLTKREEIILACHYTNIQPLWAKDNLSKGAKYIEQNV